NGRNPPAIPADTTRSYGSRASAADAAAALAAGPMPPTSTPGSPIAARSAATAVTMSRRTTSVRPGLAPRHRPRRRKRNPRVRRVRRMRLPTPLVPGDEALAQPDDDRNRAQDHAGDPEPDRAARGLVGGQHDADRRTEHPRQLQERLRPGERARAQRLDH